MKTPSAITCECDYGYKLHQDGANCVDRCPGDDEVWVETKKMCKKKPKLCANWDGDGENLRKLREAG